MNYFLAKTDPETYSLDHFEKDKKTVWDGVKNPQALRAIRDMRPGDRVFMYHSGGDSAVVGLAQVVSEPRPDPKSPKLTVIDLEFLTRLDPPTTLHEIKASGLFDGRLGAGSPGPVIDYACACGIRGLDQEEISEDQTLEAGLLHFHGVYFSQNPNSR